MGSGSSVPATLDKDAAKSAAGSSWSVEHEYKFDEMAVQGQITRQQFLKAAPLCVFANRGSLFKELLVHAPSNKSEAESKMQRRATALNPVISVKFAELAKKKREAELAEESEGEDYDSDREAQRDCKAPPPPPDAEEMAMTVCRQMEFHSESREVRMARFVSKLVKHYPALRKEGAENMSTKYDALMAKGWPKNIVVEKAYAGPTLGDEITMDCMYDLTAFYFETLHRANGSSKKRGLLFGGGGGKKHKPHLHAKYVLTILTEYLKVLRDVPNVVRVSTVVSQRITVVGDLHGQLRDLMCIFEQNSLPSATNPYVFNGDLVDRGTHSLELCVILFGLAVADPTSVRINRGNHEDYSVCDTYGFTDEIFSKYAGRTGIEIAELFAEVFAFLPIATVIDDSVFVVHGGLGRYDLEFLNKIDRTKFKTLQGVPEELWDGLDSGEIKHSEWQAMMDVLWSDPRADPGIEPNFKRGAGACWGPDFTLSWLKNEGLTEVIRSHECVEFGYEMHHDNRCMTLFSASCYYDGESNWGAYAKLNARVVTDEGSMECRSQVEIFQYVAQEKKRKKVAGEAKEESCWSGNKNAAKVNQASMDRVRLILYEYKTELLKAFLESDSSNCGSISIDEWSRVMASVVAIKLPWLHLREHFVELSEQDPTKVDYRPFVEELQASFRSCEGSTEVSIPEYIYRHLQELEACFRLMNCDGSGMVTIAEFRKACDALSLASDDEISADEKDYLIHELDPLQTGKISFVNFLNSIRFHSFETAAHKDRPYSPNTPPNPHGPTIVPNSVALAEFRRSRHSRDSALTDGDGENDEDEDETEDAPHDLPTSVSLKPNIAQTPSRRVRSASACGKLRVTRENSARSTSTAAISAPLVSSSLTSSSLQLTSSSLQ